MGTGVYQIRNLANNKRYIGSAAGRKGIVGRWSVHKTLLTQGIHHSPKLQYAWNKHGADSFVLEAILYCDPENCLMYEQIALDSMKPEYNISPTAGSSLGTKHSNTSKAKMSAARIGRFGGQNHPMYGKKHSPESRAKIAAFLTGKRTSSLRSPHKLSLQQVKEIKVLLQQGFTQLYIANLYGVKQPTISEINSGKAWRDA